MMFKNTPVLFLCVAVECIVIAVLASSLLRQGTMERVDPAYISPLRKDDYLMSSTPVFPHFYEPKQNTILNDHPQWLGHNVSYSINADALNERMEYPVTKGDHVFRILVLGDSFTFGLFVNTYENYTELLEMKLNASCPAYTGVEVINLGVPGYDIGFSAERFRLRGQKYHPDLVIWLVNPISLTRLAERETELEEKNLRELSQEEIRLHEERGEYYYPGQSAWNQLLRETSLEDRIIKQFEYFDTFLSVYSGPLLVVANKWSIWPAYVQTRIKQTLIHRPGMWLYTAFPVLLPGRDLYPDRHPNPAGHTIISESIAKYIFEENLLTCVQ